MSVIVLCFICVCVQLTFFLLIYRSSYVNCELPDVQAGFRKGRGTRDQIANICWIMEKRREFQKISISALSTMPKPLSVWITINCGETYMQVRKQYLELDVKQQTIFK